MMADYGARGSSTDETISRNERTNCQASGEIETPSSLILKKVFQFWNILIQLMVLEKV